MKSPWLTVCVVASVVFLPMAKAKLDEPAKSPSPAADPMRGKEAGEVRDDNGLKMKVVWCPPGAFVMGDFNDEDIMQDKDGPVSRRKPFDGALQIDAVHGSAEPQIWRTDVFSWAACFLIGFRRFFQRSRRERLLTQPHQDHVHRHPVQPSGKSRLATESPDLTEELQKRFLHKVFRVGRVANHSQAQGIDAAVVEPVQMLKRRGVSGLGQTDGFRFSRRSW